MVDAFIVIIDRHGQDFLGAFLSDDILIEIVMYLLGLHQLLYLAMTLPADRVHAVEIVAAELHAIAADGRFHSLQKNRHLIFASPAE